MKQNFKLPFLQQNDVVNNLLIEIGNDELSILVYSTFPFTVNGYYNYINCQFNNENETNLLLTDLLKSNNLDSQNFEKVKVFYNVNESTLVPYTFFNEKDADSILTLMFGNASNKTMFYEKTQSDEIVNLYRVSNSINSYFVNHFPQYKYAHATSFQIKNYVQSFIYCIIYDSQIKVIIQNETKFINAVYQNYTTAEDVSYHLLNICERYKLVPSNIDLILGGKIEHGSNLYNEIYKYFTCLKLVEVQETVQFDEVMTGMQIHYFEHLIKLAKCEL